VRSQARGRGIPSNTCAIEDYEWDYGQVQSSAIPRNQPPLDLPQASPNQYSVQNEYTTARPGTSTSVDDITQGMATLGTSSSSVQQPMFNKASWPTPSAPSNIITTKNPYTDSETFDPRECPTARLHFGGQCPNIW
jgi:hypothetical protein